MRCNIREQTWHVLQEVIDNTKYVDDSSFLLRTWPHDNYAILFVFIHAPNSYKGEPGNRVDRHTRHEFVVPVATYDYENWRRWVYERLCSIALHEVGEWFCDRGERVFAPHHGNGADPYVQWQLGSPEAAAKAPGED